MRQRALRRLLFWNRLWLALLALALLVWGASWFLWRSAEDIRTLHVSWEGEGLRFTSLSDGPFVVTHLARYGADESDKAVAALPEPVAITDSAGARIPAGVMKRLVWRSAVTGEPVAPPPTGAPVTALYYLPLRAEPPLAEP